MDAAMDAQQTAVVEMVRRAWAAYRRGDLDAVTALMDPAIEWDMTNYAGWPEDPVYRGHSGVRRFFADWLANWERYEAGVETIVPVTTERVFTTSWQRGYGVGSQVPVEMRLAEIITIRNALITRYEVWSDREACRTEAFRRAESDLSR